MSISVPEFTVDIAKKAGAVLMEYFGTDLTHNIKTTKDDFYTEADIAAEKVVIDAIQREFPNDSILSEEAGFLGDKNAEYQWIIDPLDGTYNFAHNEDEFGTMIARVKGKELVAGVLYNPAKDQLAEAYKGEQVRLNGKGIEVNNNTTLLNASPAIGILLKHNDDKLMIEIDNRLNGLGLNTGSMHSAIGNTFAMLTSQKNCWLINMAYPWDIAPTQFILQQAGMLVRTVDDVEVDWETHKEIMIYAPPGLYEELRDMVVEIKKGLV